MSLKMKRTKLQELNENWSTKNAFELDCAQSSLI